MKPIESLQAISTALRNHPLMQRAALAVKVADINIAVAKNQSMPRLDLVASTRFSGLDDGYGPAHDQVQEGDYTSYALGVTFEYPLGNRQGRAELRKRHLERSKAISTKRNLSQQIAADVKEKIGRVQTTYADMQIQDQAVVSARAYLQSIEDTELVRRSLTPEFLLVKLQAQESLAEARRAQVGTVAEFNRALVELARATGTVLQLHQVQAALPEPME